MSKHHPKIFHAMLILFVGLMIPLPVGAQGAIERIPADLFPLTQEPATLRVFTSGNSNVEDFATNAFTKWYEEKTGVKVDFTVAAGTGDDVTQALNLLLASGDYPDVILIPYGVVTTSQLAFYGQQGIFLPLNDLIEKGGVETKHIFDIYPQAKTVSTAPDGNIYALPSVNECYHCSLAAKMWIYQPWLDKVGLKMPTTTEEFRSVLEAFKTQDPNSNGKDDEIPLAASPLVWNGNLDIFMGSAFITNPKSHLVLSDGAVDVTYTKPEFREALRYIHSLYEEGLIAPASLTQDEDGLSRMLNSEEVTVGAVPQGWLNELADTVGEKDARLFKYVAVPPLEGPEGHREMSYAGYQATPGQCIVTAAAKDPELALRWCDAQGNEEVQLHAYFGVQDQDWRWAKPSEIGINGEPAWYVPLSKFGTVQNNQWSQTALSYRTNAWRLAAKSQGDTDFEPFLYEQSKKIESYAQPIEEVVPPLYFSAEQSQELADLEATITRYVDESIARFINGDLDIKNDDAWQNFLSQLEQMGLPRMLEIYQAAYAPN